MPFEEVKGILSIYFFKKVLKCSLFYRKSEVFSTLALTYVFAIRICVFRLTISTSIPQELSEWKMFHLKGFIVILANTFSINNYLFHFLRGS